VTDIYAFFLLRQTRLTHVRRQHPQEAELLKKDWRGVSEFTTTTTNDDDAGDVLLSSALTK